MHRECKRGSNKFCVSQIHLSGMYSCMCYQTENTLTPGWQWCTTRSIPTKHHKSLLIPAGYFKSFKPSSCLHELIPSSSSFCTSTRCLPPAPCAPEELAGTEPRPSPTGAGAEQGGLGAVVQLDGAVVGTAVHGAVERPALVDGGDVHVRGHRRAQLLPQLAVLARVRTPQACNQAQGHVCVAHPQQSNRAVRIESFLLKRCG